MRHSLSLVAGAAVVCLAACRPHSEPLDVGETSSAVGPPSVARSTITAVNDVTADGSSTSTITITVRDANSKLVSGQTVTLTASGTNDTLTQPASATSSSGVTTGTLATTKAATQVVTATITGVTGTFHTSVTFVAGTPYLGNSSFVPTPSSNIVANGSAASHLLLTLKDVNENPVGGQLVTFSAPGNGNSIAASGKTGSSGELTESLTATVAGQKTVTATFGTQLMQAQVTFVPGPPSAGRSTLTATPAASIVANGASSTSLSLTVMDATGNRLSGKTVVFSASGTGNRFQGPTNLTDGNGDLSATMTSTSSGTKTVTALVAGVGIRTTVVFDPGPPNQNKSSMTASTSIVANGTAVSTISITVEDLESNRVPNELVSLMVSGSNNTVTQTTDYLTSSTGTLTARLASTTAETKTVTASFGSVVLTKKVKFIPGPPDAQTSTIAASASSIAANGSSSSTITSTWLDAHDNPIQGLGISFAASPSSGGILKATGTTNASGIATTVLTSLTPGSESVSASYRLNNTTTLTLTLPSPVTVTVDSPTTSSTLTVSPNGVVANNSSTATVTFTARDANNETVGGQTVTLAPVPSGLTFAKATGTTATATGVYTTTVKSKTTGSYTINATVGGNVLAAATEVFVPGPPVASKSSFTATTTPVTADGVHTAALTLTLKDAQGVVLDAQAVTLSSTGSDNTFTPASGSTNTSGVFQATLSSTKAETETVTATVGTLKFTATVTFVAGPLAIVAVSAMPASVVANGTTSQVTVATTDAQGNPINGLGVVLEASNGATLGETSGTIETGGLFTTTISSLVAGTSMVSATAGGMTGSTSVTFTAGALDTSSTFQASPGPVPADGSSTITLTLTPVDANGNPLNGVEVTLSTTGSATGFMPASGTVVNGTFTSTLTSTTAGSETVDATIGGVSVSTSVTFTTPPAALPSWCQLQSPTIAFVYLGGATPSLSAQVYAVGVTPDSGGTIIGQVGYGSTQTTADQWTWSNASFSGNTGNNDIYAGTVTPAAAGTYGFAYRFSLDGTDFVYCDASGPQTAATVSNPGTLTVWGVPTITGVSPAVASTGTTVTITGTNLTAGLAFDFGSNAGSTLTASSDGTSATATVPSGTGSVSVSTTVNGTTASWSGQFVYDPGWCVLDAPTSQTIVAGQTTATLAGEVFQDSVTPNSGAGLTGQVGYGSASDTPDQWSWSSASFSSNDGNNDVFAGTLTPGSAGTYAYAFRFTADGTNYVYCDSYGLTHGFVVADAGSLTVVPPVAAPTISNVSPTYAAPGSNVTITGTNLTLATTFSFGSSAGTIVSVSQDGTTAVVTVPSGTGMATVSASTGGSSGSWSGTFTFVQAVNWCELSSPTSVTLVTGQSVTLTAQIYQPGLTPNTGAGITGQVGYGSSSASPDSWTWANATFSSDGGTNDNNDIYTATITPNPVGSYDFLYRFSLDGVTYTYCSSIGTQGDVTSSSDGSLTVLAVPTVTGVSPSQAAPGSTVTIAGTNLNSSLTYEFGSSAATLQSVSQDGTTATVTVPSGTGTSSVSVTVNGDTASWSGTFQFTEPVYYCAMNAPTALTIVSGQSATVTAQIYEPGLTPNGESSIAGQLGYGSSSASPDSWTWANASFSGTTGNNDVFTATIMPGPVGSYDFLYRFSLDGFTYTYCSSNGTQGDVTSSNDGSLTVLAVPTVTGVSPTYAAPGATVTITGTNLTSGMSYDFNSTAGTLQAVSSDGTTATVTVPSGTGTATVSANINGYSASWSGTFTFVQSVNWCELNSPTSQTIVAGQSTSTLSAQIYQPGITPTSSTGITGQVGYGSASALPDSWTWSSASATGTTGNNDVFSATLSPSTAGSYDYLFRFSLDGVTYTYCNSGGPQSDTTASSAGSLTVLATPTITNVSPSTAESGTTVTITGTGFVSGISFNFGGTTATGQSIASSTSATVTVPAGSGSVSVGASLLGATASWSSDFTYYVPPSAPSISSLSPTFMSVQGGTLTINGTSFDPNGTASVTIGGTTATIQSVTSTQIVVTAPAASAPGVQSVVVSSFSQSSSGVSLPYVLKLSGITVDGNLSDWPAAALLASASNSSNWDNNAQNGDVLSELYMGYDDNNLYIGIQGSAESGNSIIGYLSVGDLSWGSGNIGGTLDEWWDYNDALGEELSCTFDVTASGFLAQYGFGAFGSFDSLSNTIAAGGGVRRFMVDYNFDWVNSTLAQSVNNGVNGLEIAIPWGTDANAGTGSEFEPFPSGNSDPLTVSAFVRIDWNQTNNQNNCSFPNQGLPYDTNVGNGSSTVDSAVSLQIY